MGAELSRFEAAWAAYVQADEAVCVSSGASALQLGLAALGAGRGGEVLVPAFTAVPTASAVLATGATPVFVDVDPLTACMDPRAVQDAVTPRTVAAVLVHLYGYPAELPDVGLPIVEDAAQAHGALTDVGRSVLTAYSFYPTKNLGGIGDGGAVVTNQPAIADYVRLARVHGMRAQYEHHIVSQNHRMSELEAAWLSEAIHQLDADVTRRRHIARAYRTAAPNLAWQTDHDRHAYHLCVLRHNERDWCREVLAARGVGTAVHYPYALTQQPAYQHMATSPCPEAESWAAECISLPCFPEMTDDELAVVCAALAELDPWQ
jgi:dTDP-4-amino-4,6-dideoxygalactose transaminase